MPMALYSFLENHDLNGKTIIPFATSGGTGFSGSIEVMQSMCLEAVVLDGLLLGGSCVASSDRQTDKWHADRSLRRILPQVISIAEALE